MRTNIQTHASTGAPYSTQNTSLHRGHPSQQRGMADSIPASRKERHSTQLIFTDGWTALCSNCSSTHNLSRAGDTHSLYTSFTSCPNYCLSWRLVLQGKLWGALTQRRLTWGQAGAGVEAGGREHRKQNRQPPATLIPGKG